MHVVLGTDPHPDPSTRDELIFTYQEDHIFWVESFLALNPILTLGLGPLCLKYMRPVAGKLTHTHIHVRTYDCLRQGVRFEVHLRTGYGVHNPSALHPPVIDSPDAT